MTAIMQTSSMPPLKIRMILLSFWSALKAASILSENKAQTMAKIKNIHMISILFPSRTHAALYGYYNFIDCSSQSLYTALK